MTTGLCLRFAGSDTFKFPLTLGWTVRDKGCMLPGSCAHFHSCAMLLSVRTESRPPPRPGEAPPHSVGFLRSRALPWVLAQTLLLGESLAVLSVGW